ncbi:MAG TPA: hypothetical protein VFV11_08955 [Solimonas sp.]|nr:hypothetical protein [Solimonas sp.]
MRHESMRTALPTLLLLGAARAWAHDGHGAAPGAHLHAFDLAVLAAIVVLFGAWLWHRRGR